MTSEPPEVLDLGPPPASNPKRQPESPQSSTGPVALKRHPSQTEQLSDGFDEPEEHSQTQDSLDLALEESTTIVEHSDAAQADEIEEEVVSAIQGDLSDTSEHLREPEVAEITAQTPEKVSESTQAVVEEVVKNEEDLGAQGVEEDVEGAQDKDEISNEQTGQNDPEISEEAQGKEDNMEEEPSIKQAEIEIEHEVAEINESRAAVD